MNPFTRALITRPPSRCWLTLVKLFDLFPAPEFTARFWDRKITNFVDATQRIRAILASENQPAEFLAQAQAAAQHLRLALLLAVEFRQAAGPWLPSVAATEALHEAVAKLTPSLTLNGWMSKAATASLCRFGNPNGKPLTRATLRYLRAAANYAFWKLAEPQVGTVCLDELEAALGALAEALEELSRPSNPP